MSNADPSRRDRRRPGQRTARPHVRHRRPAHGLSRPHAVARRGHAHRPGRRPRSQAAYRRSGRRPRVRQRRVASSRSSSKTFRPHRRRRPPKSRRCAPPARCCTPRSIASAKRRFSKNAGFPAHPVPHRQTQPRNSAPPSPRSASPAILKTADFGYDGKGQVRIQSPGRSRGRWDSIGRVPAVLEAFIAFRMRSVA